MMLAPERGLARAVHLEGVVRGARRLAALELPIRARRAGEGDLSRLIGVLVAAEVGPPALVICRQPQRPAFLTPRDQRNALERHATSLGRCRTSDYSVLPRYAGRRVRKQTLQGKRFRDG
jgi:hypothetical protein